MDRETWPKDHFWWQPTVSITGDVESEKKKTHNPSKTAERFRFNSDVASQEPSRHPPFVAVAQKLKLKADSHDSNETCNDELRCRRRQILEVNVQHNRDSKLI